MPAVRKIGRYEVKSKLGEGGMGEVFLAHDAELEREVAIKVLLSEFCYNLERVNRFKLEAKAASALNHPNIITIYEIGGGKDALHIVTEFIEGKTLRGLLQRGWVTLESAFDIALQVAGALNAAHKEGIVHRDIKPENIMVREDGIVKVLDFGLAKPGLGQGEGETGRGGEDNSTLTMSPRPRVSASPLLQSPRLTSPGMVLGSVGYMSPEQARGKEVDGRTDVWSLGVVFYEMLTGGTPFDGETLTDILANIIHKEPQPITDFLPDAPLGLQHIINKSLAKKCEDRYQTVKDFASDLKNLRREFGFGEVDGFMTGNFEKPTNPTTDINLHDTREAKTLIQNSVSAETLTQTVSPEIKTSPPIKRSGWIIQVAIVGFAVLIALGAWYFRPIQFVPGELNSLQISTVADSDKAFAPAISVDGKYLAYINYENGKKTLMVEQIATGSKVPLVAQTENEGFLPPTFSPDGYYVYYVLADKGVGTLFQISTLGGTPKKLLNDVDSKVTFSPDGKQIAFRRRDAVTGIESIFIANSDGTNEKSFISSRDLGIKAFKEVAWSPRGIGLLISGGGDVMPDEIVKSRLMLVTLAEKRIAKFGEKDWLNANSFYWTKDKSSLLMLAKSTEQEPAQIWQISYPEGTEIKRLTNDSSGFETMSYSPEADIITAAKQSTFSSLWSFNPTSKELAQITTDNKSLLGATGFEFTPDGRILTSEVENNKSNLVLLTEDGKEEKSLTANDSFNGQAVISPDGRFVVYSAAKNEMVSLWRIDIDGANALQLTKPENEYDSRPQITADGKFIIFERRSADFTKSSLLKIPIEGGEPLPLVTDDKQMQILPKLSDDGKFLVYSTMSFDKANTRFNRSVKVHTMNGNTPGELKKSFDTYFGFNYRFTPDGKNLTYINQTGVPNIFNVPLDGNAPKQLTNFNSGHTVNFAWSKDGKKLYIVRAIINSELLLLKNSRG
jgi:eukaryotic-like serine/threonine-protein kinase